MAQVAALQVGGDPRVHPDDFRSTVFATGLHYPYGMARLADGSLLVGTSRPTGPTAGYFSSVGELVRLVDEDGDGVADGLPTVVHTGLPGALTALARAGHFVFVVSVVPGRISVLREGPGPTYTLAGVLHLTFPSNWWHHTYGLAVRARPDGGEYDLVFNVGSSGNFSQTEATVTASGMASGELVGASLYALRFRDARRRLRVGELHRVASGLRNAAGLAFHEVTGDLYLEDNGIDGFVDGDEAFSADEINRLTLAQVRSPAVESFGFPDNYVEYRTGHVVGGEGLPPVCAFTPVGNPPSENEGAAAIALAPARFPPGLNHGVFVGFHGKDAAGLANEENPVAYCDPQTGDHFHFVDNDAAVGHLDGLLATDDSLFLADLSSEGTLGPAGAGTGVIYQVKAVIPPPSPARRP